MTRNPRPEEDPGSGPETTTPGDPSVPADGAEGSGTVADVMVRYLQEAGIGHVFGYPGTPNIEFIEQGRRRGIDLVLARREGTAGFMAAAAGMLSGRPGVCMSTLGPGSTSLVNAVANAYLDRVPLIAISGQTSTLKEPYFTHQVVDHQRLFAPITKWVSRVQPGAAGATMRKALRVAMAERPGSVHLSTSADHVSAQATDAEVILPPMGEVEMGVQLFGSPGVDGDPAEKLRKAARPVILAGIAAARRGCRDALVAFSEATGTPVVVSPMAKGVFPEDHPYFAGTLDMACNDVVWALLTSADLLLVVGFDAVELIKPWQVRAPTIHIDMVPNTDQIYRADFELVGPIPTILDALRSVGRGEAKWSEAEVEGHRTRLRDTYYSGRVNGRLNPTDVVDALMTVYEGRAILSTDVGSHKLLVGQGWRPAEQRTFLMTNGLSSMGFSLPAAIAAKLVRPDSHVVSTVGDGGFAMVQGELGLAAERGLGIVVVVFCDDSLNRIEIKQNLRGYPSQMTRIDPIDLPKVAEGMGCHGERVDEPDRLRTVLEGAKEGLDRPLVIEARIDPSQYTAQF